jgi:hypothetical protein
MQGYLGDYWAQGMEEPAWLIFQDERFCETPKAGWAMEGMHQMGPGDRLTIFAPGGEVLWAGTLETRRVGFFGRLQAGAHDWHPEGMDLSSWRAFFHHDPPLRATYQPGPGSGA